MFALVANWLGRMFGIFGIALDIRELVKLLLRSWSAGVVSGVVAFIRDQPIWVVVLVIVTVWLISLIILALISKKNRKDNKYADVPKLLRQIDRRLAIVSKKVDKKLSQTTAKAFEEDVYTFFGITKKQKQVLERPSQLRQEAIERLRKQLGVHIDFAEAIYTIADAHNISPEYRANSDIRYRLFLGILEGLLPMPTPEIGISVMVYQLSSSRLRTIQMLYEPHFGEVRKKLPVKVWMVDKQFLALWNNINETILTHIKQEIDEWSQRRQEGSK